ncbi:MAG: phosphate ABC transporter substrate-binding protein PstS [Paludibacteraceae bacterium]|nr:phosphate ABC transporter substrate-binding protein PstS [Paludibacteraceae bacterium]
MKKIFSSIMTLTVALAMTACGGNSNDGGRKAQELSGAGATFPLPFYNVVFENFSQVNGDVVAYGGIGSGGGVRNLRDKIVDFAGSDAFLSDKEMTEMNPVIHIPTCMGAVVLAYNLDGVSELKLSGEVIADIFAGNIKMWNDERLVALNPDVTLPAEAIIPVFRSDGSGTTFVFTDYLTKVSPMWASNYGAGKSVNFPSGQAAKGNPGVAGVIKQTKNSIGYVGSEYAFAQKIPYARIQNARSEFVLPSSASISAAASGEIPADTRCSITNADAAGAYPISTFTWMIIYKEQNYSDRSKEQAMATLELLKYILSDEAQNISSEVHYAPLPAKAKELSMTNLKTVTFDGVAILQ